MLTFLIRASRNSKDDMDSKKKLIEEMHRSEKQVSLHARWGGCRAPAYLPRRFSETQRKTQMLRDRENQRKAAFQAYQQQIEQVQHAPYISGPRPLL